MNHPFSPNFSRIGKCGKYNAIKCPSHPNCWKNGYIYLHRIIAEIKIGRILNEDEIVHHKDENGHNNHPDNLEVIADQSIHAKIHKPQKPEAWNEVVCDNCGIKFKRRKSRSMEKLGSHNIFCSHSCNGKFNGYQHALEAQLDEHLTPNEKVAGSIPA